MGFRIGDTISGKYRIDDVIGAGAMGTVVLAYWLVLQKHVAIKFLHPDRVGNRDASLRFIREAQAAIQLNSEHATRVYGIDSLETGEPYIVMEYLRGRDLAKWIEQDGPMEVRDAVDYILQACDAIAEAHGRGIVHRDLKPANLFLVEDGANQRRLLKVLDFGISKTKGIVAATIDPSDPRVDTGTATIMGSPFYMAPEQADSAKDVDHRADIWALGIILCELVTGSVPFKGTTLVEIYAKMIAASPRVLPATPRRIPPELVGVIQRCLERWPANRYDGALSLSRALRPFASPRGRAVLERLEQRERPSDTNRVASSTMALREVVATQVSDGTLPSQPSPKSIARLSLPSPAPAVPISVRVPSRHGSALVVAWALALVLVGSSLWFVTRYAGRTSVVARQSPEVTPVAHSTTSSTADSPATATSGPIDDPPAPSSQPPAVPAPKPTNGRDTAFNHQVQYTLRLPPKSDASFAPLGLAPTAAPPLAWTLQDASTAPASSSDPMNQLLRDRK